MKHKLYPGEPCHYRPVIVSNTLSKVTELHILDECASKGSRTYCFLECKTLNIISDICWNQNNSSY